jgi:glycosyltransferase involved in cell wall biosynthesis
MRILYLASEFPYPPDSGARIKTLSILDYLRAGHDVSPLCLRRRPLDEDQSRWAAAFGGVRTVQLDRGRNALNLARSYLHGVPLSVERNRSDAMRRLVEETLDGGGFDALFVDGWVMAQYLPQGFEGRRLLHEHNAEYLLWERQAALQRNPLRRALVLREAARVRRYEGAMLRRFDAVFAVSEADREALAAIGGARARLNVLPNLPDPGLLERPALSFEAAGMTVGYLGTLSWQPNIEGVEHFIRDVLPILQKRAPGSRFLLAGRGAPARLERLARGTTGVGYLGPVADDEAVYSRARVMVEATRSGGGTKLKVLNALARGLPAVVSPQAAEGLHVASGEHLLIADGAEEMAPALASVMTGGALWRRLSENGRAVVRERYVAGTAFTVLDEVLSGDRAPA